MYRYAEGAGTAARFNSITDIDFLSSTELICTDAGNHCLRLSDFTLSPPETSRFAGNCTMSGDADGHRLYSALFDNLRYTEFNSNKSIMLVLEYSMTLHMIDLRTDNVTTLITFDNYCNNMKILEDSLLYVAQITKVVVFNIGTREQSVVAGGNGKGNTIGPFEHTKFSCTREMYPWSDEVKTTLLVADYCNNRFVGS